MPAQGVNDSQMVNTASAPLRTALVRLLSTILLLAAISKLVLLVSDPFSDLHLGFPKFVLWLTIVFEVCVGVRGFTRSSTSSWLELLFCFSLFLVISSVRAITGQRTCGCWGYWDTPIEAAIGFNLIVCCALVLLRPASHERQQAVNGI